MKNELALMDSVLALTHSLETHQINLLKERQQFEQKATDRLLINFIALLLLKGIIIIIIYIRLRNQIKKQRVNERSLAESKNWFSSTLSAIGDGVIVTDEKTGVTFMNKIAEELTGWKLNEAIGRPIQMIFEISNSKNNELVENPILKAIKQKKIVTLPEHTVLIRRDKSIIDIDDSAAPIINYKGEVTGVVMVFRDIREKREIEAKNEEITRFMNAIIENIPSMLYVKDAKTLKYLQLNKTAEEFAGFPRSVMLGKTDNELFEPKQVEIMNAADNRLLNSNEKVIAEEQEVNFKGVIKWIYNRKIIIPDEKGEPLYLLGIAEDITDKRIMEDELKKFTNDLEKKIELRTFQLAEKNKELNTFVYKATHDLRTPLSSLKGLINVMTTEIKDLKCQMYFKMIAESVDKLDAILTLLLNSMHVKEKVVQLEEINLHHFVSSIINELAYKQGFTRIKFKLSFPETTSIKTDHMLLNVILKNLLQNAIKFQDYTIENPFVEVNLTKHENWNIIKVTDNGIGIPAEQTGKIFTMFFRGNQQIHGTGLGLYTVKSAVEVLHGHLHYKKEAKGSSFIIELPE
jgi:PAS domain S-box-containing protein